MCQLPALCAAALLSACATCASAADAGFKADGLWRGNAGAAASLSAGNTEASSLSVNIDLVRASADDKISLAANTTYGRSRIDGVTRTSASKWAGTGQYDQNLGPQAYTFSKLGLESDRITGLVWRLSLSAGLGHKFVATPDAAFSVFGGVGLSDDRYDSPQTIRGETAQRFSRANTVLGEESAHRLTPTVEVKQRLEITSGISGDRANILRFSAGLAVAMNSHLNLTVGLVDTYNSQPPAGLKNNDLALFTGISLKLGEL
jgi:putative salt-induced outer membrane protein